MRQHFIRYIRWVAVWIVLALLSACAKEGHEYSIFPSYYEGYSSDNSKNGVEAGLAIGTVRSREGVRYIRLDEKSYSQVMNPQEIAAIKDGTRVFLQYRYVVSPSLADFCTDAILVEWASPLEMGEIHFEMNVIAGDPVGILPDWITTLEDGFLTLHYSIHSSGNVKHGFSLYPSVETNTYQFVHEANGDNKGALDEGIVCFDVSGLLPETEGETVELHLDYTDLNNTQKRLTVEYQSPK